MAPIELVLHIGANELSGHVSGAFVHNLHSVFPSAFRQLSLGFELGKLRFVVCVGNRTGTQAVADGNADIVSCHDFANFVPMFPEKILRIMALAPFCHDRAAAGNDAGDARGDKRNEIFFHTSMNRKIVHALFGLFDQCFAEDFPIDFFAFSADFFKGLINRHRPDGNRAIAQNPFPRRMNIFPRGKVHQRVPAPTAGPSHFIDFLFDPRGDGGIADVCIDFNQKIAPDNHRFRLRMVNVGGKNGTSSGNFRAHEFRRYLLRNCRSEILSRMHEPEVLTRRFRNCVVRCLQLHVFANGNKFHFRRDNAALGIIHLRDACTRFGSVNFPIPSVELFDMASRFYGGNDITRHNRFDIAALQNPRSSQGWKPLANILMKSLVAPRPGSVVNAYGRIFVQNLPGSGASRRKRDFAHRHTDVRARTFDINAAALRERRMDFITILLWGFVSHRQNWGHFMSGFGGFQ